MQLEVTSAGADSNLTAQCLQLRGLLFALFLIALVSPPL